MNADASREDLIAPLGAVLARTTLFRSELQEPAGVHPKNKKKFLRQGDTHPVPPVWVVSIDLDQSAVIS